MQHYCWKLLLDMCVALSESKRCPLLQIVTSDSFKGVNFVYEQNNSIDKLLAPTSTSLCLFR